MIKVLRVDDRLLHGQVAAAWCGFYQVDTILVANNDLLTDQTMQTAFRLATPPETILSMKSLQGAVEVLNNPKHESRKIMVITKSISDARFIEERTGDSIKHILIGGLRKGEHKKQVDLNSYLDEFDMENLTALYEKKIDIIMQADPTSRKLRYDDIKKNYNK